PIRCYFDSNLSLQHLYDSGVACNEIRYGINQFVPPPDISIFPNPFSNIFILKSNKEITSIFISDALGRQIAALNPNDSEVQIDLKGQPKGLYLVRIDSGNQ